MRGACVGRGTWVLALLPFLWAPAIQAASLPEIQTRAQQVAAERPRLQREGKLDARAEQALIGRLGELVLAFIDQSDQAAQVGNERREGLKPAFEALYDPLHAAYATRNEFMERQSKAIMDADGDLEALYETREWREAQSLAAQALYYLNWLGFYGARLSDGPRRKELLEAAERGFSEFATGAPRKDLMTESTLGRGLCHLELGHYDWAIRDFKAVIDEPTVSPERKEKARLALLDAYGRGGKFKEALSYSQELLNGGTLDANDATMVRFYRLHTLFDAMKGAAPADAERGRREASALMDQLRKAGKGWSDKVDALLVARVENPAQWVGKVDTPAAKWELANLLLQKNDEAHALPLLEEIAQSDDPTARSHRAEASYFLGVARFKAGDYVAALTRLEAAAAGSKPEFAAEVAYLRYKALEALMATGGSEELGGRYAAALREFLQQYPEHPQSYEARYRLGEYLQAQSDFTGAIEAYAAVRGEAGFEFRARFGTLQSAFEQLKDAQGAAAREPLLARIGQDLDAFWVLAKSFEQKKDRGDLPLADFQAKATVMQAVYLSLRDADGSTAMLTWLSGFEPRYPDQGELFAQVARLRLGAYQRLGRFAEAAREVSTHAAVLNADGKTEAIEKLANGFVKAGARRTAAGDVEGGKAAEQVAVRLYELLNADDRGSTDQAKLTLARLYESGDDLDRAEAAYRDLLTNSPTSLAALRGLAHVAESRKNLAEALGYWKRYTEGTRPGDPNWYAGHYEQARLTLARGDRTGSCARLTELKPAMPGLSDADLRRQLAGLYKRACE